MQMNGVIVESDLKAKLYHSIRRCGVPFILCDSFALANYNSDNKIDENDIDKYKQNHNLYELGLSEFTKFYLHMKNYSFLDRYISLSKIVVTTWNSDNQINGLRIIPILKIVASTLESQTINSPIYNCIHLKLYNLLEDRLLIGHLRKGRRISERSIVKWSWQLLASLNICHQNYICYCMTANDIHLTSDFAVLKEIRKSLGHKSRVISNDPPLRTLSDAWISPHRIIYSIIKNRNSSVEQNIKMFTSISVFEGNDQKCYVPSNHPQLEDVRKEYAEFTHQLQLNYRHLGLVIAQLLLKQSLPLSELDHYSRNTFCFEDFHKIFDTAKLPKALKDLVSLCFSSTIDHREIQYTETGMTVFSTALRSLASSIQNDLGILFAEMGGEVISFETPLYWTSADEEKRQKDILDRTMKLQQKAETGRKEARRRLLRHKYQVEYDLLPEEKQRRIAAKREARQISRRNSRRRKAAIICGSFRHWQEDQFQHWIYEAIYSSLIHSKKLLLHHSNGRKGDKLIFQRADDFLAPVATVQSNLLKRYTKVIYANLKQFPTAAELEIDQINSFKSYATHLSGVVIRRMTAMDAERRMTSIQSDIHDKLQGNSLTRVLPPLKYSVLREKSEAEVYAGSRVIHNIAYELGQDLGHTGDDQWTNSVSKSLAAAMLLKFDKDKEQRDFGVYCASSRIQGLCRQIIVKRKVEEIWRRVDTMLLRESEYNDNSSNEELDSEAVDNVNDEQTEKDINDNSLVNNDNQSEDIINSDTVSKEENLPNVTSTISSELYPLTYSHGKNGMIKITVLGVSLRNQCDKSVVSELPLNDLRGEMLTFPDNSKGISMDSSLDSIYHYIKTNFRGNNSNKSDSPYTSAFDKNYVRNMNNLSSGTTYHLLKLYDEKKLSSPSSLTASFPVRVIISQPYETNNIEKNRSISAGKVDRVKRRNSQSSCENSLIRGTSKTFLSKLRETSGGSVLNKHIIPMSSVASNGLICSNSNSSTSLNCDVSTILPTSNPLQQYEDKSKHNNNIILSSVISSILPKESEKPKEYALHIMVDHLPAACHHIIHIVGESIFFCKTKGIDVNRNAAVKDDNNSKEYLSQPANDNDVSFVYIGSVAVVTPPARPSPPQLLPLQIFRYTRNIHKKSQREKLSQTNNNNQISNIDSTAINLLWHMKSKSSLANPNLLTTKLSQVRLESVVKPKVEQVAAIRIQWTAGVPHNSSDVNLFEVQRRFYRFFWEDWEVLVVTESNVYSDIIQQCEIIKSVEYRVRLKNSCGWSDFSFSLTVTVPLSQYTSLSNAEVTMSKFKIPFLQSDSLLDMVLQSDSSIQFGNSFIEKSIESEVSKDDTEIDNEKIMTKGQYGTVEVSTAADHSQGIQNIEDWLHGLSEACPIDVTAAKDQLNNDISHSMGGNTFSHTNRFLKNTDNIGTKTKVSKNTKNKYKSKTGSLGETIFLPSLTYSPGR